MKSGNYIVDKFKFQKGLIITAAFISLCSIGLIVYNYATEYVAEGLRDYIAEQGIWAKSQKSATINLIYYLHTGNEDKYEVYQSEMRKLLLEKKALGKLEKNDEIDVDLLLKPLLSTLTAEEYDHLVGTYQAYSSPLYRFFLPGANIFDEAFLIREHTEKKLMVLQSIAQNIQQDLNNGGLTNTQKESYLIRLYQNDKALTSLAHHFTREMTMLSSALKWYARFNLILLAIIIAGMGFLATAIFYRSIKEWRDSLVGKLEELKLIFENSQDGILLIQQNGVIRSSNPAADKMFSDSATPLEKHDLSEIIQMDNRSTQRFIHSVDRYNSFRSTLPIYLREGDPFIAELSASTGFLGENSKFYCVVVRDETETLEYIDKINESEKTYRDLFNGLSDGILIQDKNGKFIDVNEAATEMFGYDKEEMTGRTPSFLLTPASKNESSKSSNFEKAFEGKPQIFNRWALKKDGNTVPIEIKLTNGLYFGEEIVIAIVRDISERHKSINELRKSYDENKVLLKEIHHRVKNNMALISGLIFLQANTIQDPDLRKILHKFQFRIHTIADIHEILYRENQWSQIDFKKFLQSLIDYYQNGQKIFKSNVHFVLNSTNLTLNINQAIPCALLVNELLMNAKEHAFPKDQRGEIRIDIEKEDGWVQIKVSDNGVGLSQTDSFKSPNSLGIELINTLAEQLDANLEIQSNGGTHYEINFKHETQQKGIGSSWLN